MEQGNDYKMGKSKQTYGEFRRAILTPNQLQALSHLSTTRVMRDTIFLWTQILAAWALVALWENWISILIAIFVVGTRYYALYIIGHDGLHRRLFNSRRKNDLWNDVFILGAIGAITRINRHNHMRHHAALALPTDPDLYKYNLADRNGRIQFVLSLTGLPHIQRAIRNVFFDGAQHERKVTDHHTIRDIAILLGWQIMLIGALTFLIGWWAYPLIWLLPVYIFTFAADTARVMLEHAVESDPNPALPDRLITYKSSRIERIFFAPMNMNFHATHHLWPSIPYYNLPAADAMLRSSPKGARLALRGSYCARLIAMAAARPWISKRAVP